jgi:hypothetical protein
MEKKTLRTYGPTQSRWPHPLQPAYVGKVNPIPGMPSSEPQSECRTVGTFTLAGALGFCMLAWGALRLARSR